MKRTVGSDVLCEVNVLVAWHNDEKCFLCGPCREVTIENFQLTPRQTGRLTVGRKLTSTSTSTTFTIILQNYAGNK
jgi:hypothetical protein